MQVCGHILPVLAVFGEELPADADPTSGKLQVCRLLLRRQLCSLSLQAWAVSQ